MFCFVMTRFLIIIPTVDTALRHECHSYSEMSWYSTSSGICYTFNPTETITVTTSIAPAINYCAADQSGRPPNGSLAVVPSRRLRDQIAMKGYKAIVALERVSWTSEAEAVNSNYSWFLGDQRWTIPYLEWNSVGGEPSNRDFETIGYMNGNTNNRFHDTGNVDRGALCQFDSTHTSTHQAAEFEFAADDSMFNSVESLENSTVFTEKDCLVTCWRQPQCVSLTFIRASGHCIQFDDRANGLSTVLDATSFTKRIVIE